MAEQPPPSPPDIAEIDKTLESPQVRALKVWSALRQLDFTDYDLLCFGLEHAARVGMALDDEFFLIVKAALKWLYNIHYNHPEVFSGIHQVESISGTDVSVPTPDSEGEGGPAQP